MRCTQLAGWPQFRNGFDCIVAAARGGLKESYRGIGPAIALAPHAAIQMAVYERLKRNQWVLLESLPRTTPSNPVLDIRWFAKREFLFCACRVPAASTTLYYCLFSAPIKARQMYPLDCLRFGERPPSSPPSASPTPSRRVLFQPSRSLAILISVHFSGRDVLRMPSGGLSWAAGASQ